MPALTVALRRLPHAADLPLPAYATASSAGMDLVAAIEGEATLTPGARALVPTGIAIALPDGYEAQVRPRSGLALKTGVTVLNSPGTIDADYRGEIQVILINHGADPVAVRRGDRIAQLVVAPVTRITWAERSSLDDTDRGPGGFGSTGSSIGSSTTLTARR
ncbi:dUTP diphosphatase [Rhodospirillaceae bacterium SYSU D60014]|uniref:dUTP diphosphatase n=1 Tax=Virgifigura deserti TaxID=2268457 RepID=UPI000E660F95